MVSQAGNQDDINWILEQAKQSIHDMWKLVEFLVKQKGTIEEKFDFLGGQVDNANQRGQVEQKLDIIHESQLILGKNQEFMRDSDDKFLEVADIVHFFQVEGMLKLKSMLSNDAKKEENER